MSGWPQSSGQAAGLIRELDGSTNPLGPPAAWPQSLKTVVELMLASPRAMSLVWGGAAIHLYNDPFAELLLKGRAPTLGRPVFEAFGRSRDAFADDLARGMAGEAVQLRAQYYPVERDGRVERAWFDVDYVPLRREDGQVAGVLWTLLEATDELTAHAQLRESEARFRALVTAGTYSIYRMSPDWRLMYQLDSQTLANTSEPIEDWVEKYILPEDLPQVRAAIDVAIQTKSLFELEHRVRLANGEVGWVISRAVLLLGGDGEITEWFGAGSDITERRVAAEALRRAEARLRSELEDLVAERTVELKANRDLLKGIIDSSMDMIQVFQAIRDETGRIVDFTWTLNNHTSESRYGQVRGESLLQRNPGVVQEGIFDAFARVTETGTPEQAERHYVHEQFDGWFYQSVVKLGDGVATTTKEISDWKAAQAELLSLQAEVADAKLRESQARLDAALESVPVGVAIVDRAGRSLVANAEYRRFLPTGLIPSRDPASRPRWRGWDAEGRQLDLQAYPGTRALSGERVVPGQEMLFTDDQGHEIWTSVATVPIFDGAGEVSAVVTVISDIDAHKRALEALSQGERQARLLLAELQHRVRNTLALVRSIVRRTAERARDVDDFEAHLTGRLSALGRTQALLTRAPGAGVDLAELVHEELLAQIASEERVSVEGPAVLLSPKAAEVLTLAIHELATNAIKYGALADGKGRVAVGWRREAGEGGPWLFLDWAESGVAVIAPSPRPSGFGTELITHRVPYELNGRGEMELRPGGLIARIAFPLRPGESILATDSPLKGGGEDA